ncbi:TetR/AcrR family transcriptional regulator [Nocardia sp. NBC_00565]|uniref:TetR/AcrR family transcriptional regulator n=1 Tax=Nocardia sp. NBC_00565 TaxID=2975993 RepID=UPI002E8207EF|nr:helix-turn-helix domain-containing protein [Nocardia sp. NBC_00565]WUC05592.1 TetR/AcrR family transcriptional regulator [Nocardia sp. NBC_00565]
MTRQKSDESKVKDAQQQPDTYEPVWQQRSVERSLQNAKVRAKERSDKFVGAAVELLAERDESEVTIQDVVDRSTMSLRTYYSFFDSRDSLLLATYETILSQTAMPMLRERCEQVEDPVERVKALMQGMLELGLAPGKLSRALSKLHLRLAEARPNDLKHALGPLRACIVELLQGVEAAGRLRDDLDLDTQAALLQELMLATTHSTVLGGGSPTSAEDLWAFCSAAILRPARKRPSS